MVADIDNGALLILMSISPGAPSQQDTTDKGVLPDHLFSDDRVTLGVGRGDTESLTVTLGVADLLAGHKLCRDVDGT